MTRHKPAENVVILRSSQRISTWQTEQCMKISWSSHWSMVMKINTYCSYSSGKFGNESALSVIGFFSGSNKYPVELQTDSSNDGPTVEDLANLAARLTDVPRGSQRLIFKGEWHWREAALRPVTIRWIILAYDPSQQIFLLTHDWSKHITWPNIPYTKIGGYPRISLNFQISCPLYAYVRAK